MSLHDRIMKEADRHTLETEHGCGYVDGMTRAAAIAKQADELMEEMAKISTGEISHNRMGMCPDFMEGFESRDDSCPACQILLKYKAWKEQSK